MKTKDPFKDFFKKIINLKENLVSHNFRIKTDFNINFTEETSENQLSEENSPLNIPILLTKPLKKQIYEKNGENSDKNGENCDGNGENCHENGDNRNQFIERIFDELMKDLKEKHQIIFRKNEKNDDNSFDLMSNSLWQIEGLEKHKGGIMQWDQLYRFKHFSTGKYLSICEENKVKF